MELEIYNPKEDGYIQAIEFNKDEIKAYINQNLDKYQGLIYDDSSIKSAKTDRSTLNNFKNVLDNKRKEIKNKCLEPYNAFESSIKELIALIDQPLLAIDDQVKEYESRNKTEKRHKAMEIYEEIFQDYQEVIGFNSIEDKRWQNSTYNINDVRVDIKRIYTNIKLGVKIIKDKKSEFETTLLDVFFTTRDLDLVLRKEESLVRSKEALLEAERIKKQRLESQNVPTEQENHKKTQIKEPADKEPIKDKRVWFNFNLYLNEKEFNEIKEWIQENKIEARKVGN